MADDRDLDWLACQFVLGEMDDAAARAFGARMLADPECVAAVDRAVESLELLRQAVGTAEPRTAGPVIRTEESRVQVASQRMESSRRAAWSVRPAWLVAAALLLSVTGGLRLGWRWYEARHQERMLAAAWVDQSALDAEESGFLGELIAVQELGDEESAGIRTGELDLGADDGEPGGWILAAALLLDDPFGDDDLGG